MPPIILVVGPSGSGKTTLIEQLIPELTGRGYKVGVIKHTHHAVEMDKKGKDSWRHRQAGASAVALAAGTRMALTRDIPDDDPARIARHMDDMDLIITEGCKNKDYPKIEVFRKIICQVPMHLHDPYIKAIATDMVSGPASGLKSGLRSGREMNFPIPHYALTDISGIADWMEKAFL